MTFKSPEFLTDYVRVLGEVIRYADAARRMGMSKDIVFRWLRASKAAAEKKEDPSEWLLTIDGERRYFHQFCRQVQTNCTDEIIANSFVRARDGVWTVARYMGQTVYQLNPDWIDEGMRDLLGLTDKDKYLRVRGKLVPELVWTPPAGDFVAFMLGANSKRYRKQSTLNVNANANGGGVLRWEEPKPKLAAPIPVEVIEDRSKFGPPPELIGVFEEITQEEDRPLADEPETPDFAATDTDPGTLPAVPLADAEEIAEPEPAPVAAVDASGPMIAEAVPDLTKYSPGKNPLVRKLSDAERAILAKLPSDNSGVRAALKGQ